MVDSTVPKAGVMPAPPRIVLGRERLLGATEIRELTGLGEVAAASLMKESGRCLKLHSRLFVIESSFFEYLHELEVTNPCNL